jgi:hypothetical protein
MRTLIISAILISVSVVSALDFPSKPYSHTVPCGDELLAFTKGLNNKFILFDNDGGVITDSIEMGLDYQCFMSGACSPDGDTIAVWTDNNTEVWVLLLDGNGVLREKLGPYYNCGCPVWNESGNLWYMADDTLYKDGKPQSFPQGFTLEVDSIDVSPDGRSVTFTDLEGRIYEADIEGGSPEIIAEDESFDPPKYTPAGDIFAVSGELLDVTNELAGLDYEIWLFDKDRNGRLIGNGIDPSWYVDSGGSGLEGILFAATTDHPMDVTDSEIWLAELDGELWQMTNTQGIAETNPVDWNDDIIVVDGITSDLIHIEQEW